MTPAGEDESKRRTLWRDWRSARTLRDGDSGFGEPRVVVESKVRDRLGSAPAKTRETGPLLRSPPQLVDPQSSMRQRLASTASSFSNASASSSSSSPFDQSSLQSLHPFEQPQWPWMSERPTSTKQMQRRRMMSAPWNSTYQQMNVVNTPNPKPDHEKSPKESFVNLVLIPFLKGGAAGILLSLLTAYLLPILFATRSNFAEVERGRVKLNGCQVDAVCARVRLFHTTHLVGPNVSSFPAEGILSCCRVCGAMSDCVAASFSHVDNSCTIFFHVVYGAFQSAWALSIVLMSERQVTGKYIEDFAVRPEPLHGTTWWDAVTTHKMNQGKMLYHVSAAYKDMQGQRKVREDYRRDVGDALQALGMQSSPDRERAHFVWDLHWAQVNKIAMTFTSWQTVNMIPGAGKKVFGEKDALHATLRAAREHFMEGGDFVLESFLLPQEKDAFLEATRASEGSLWVWKELASWSGAGIQLLSVEQVSERLEETVHHHQSVVLQRYEERPLTLMGHKFDTRWWVLVSSVSPLRVYYIADSYIRVAVERYSVKKSSDLGNKCIHITNGKIQAKCEKDAAKERRGHHRTVDGFPKRLCDPQLLSLLSDSNGHTIHAKEETRSTLMASAQNAILQTILAGLPRLRTFQTSCKAHCFQLLAFDILFTESLRARVLEVNTNGFLGSGMKMVSEQMSGKPNQILVDMLSLVGANGYDRSFYQLQLERALSPYLHENATILHVQAFMDEAFHRGLWKPLYPFPVLTSLETAKAKFAAHFDVLDSSLHSALSAALHAFPYMSFSFLL